MSDTLSYQKIVIRSYAEPIVDSILSTTIPTVDYITNLINELTEKTNRLRDPDILGMSLFYIGAALKESDFASYYIFLLAFYNDDYESVKQADINIEETLKITNELRNKS